MCVGTSDGTPLAAALYVSMPHAALCVSGLPRHRQGSYTSRSFNAARSIVCVGTTHIGRVGKSQHSFNAARSIVCVGTEKGLIQMKNATVSMPHAALCVSGHEFDEEVGISEIVSMPHAALCVSGQHCIIYFAPQF